MSDVLQELHQMLIILRSDVEKFNVNESDQSARRIFVRAVFALVEGMTYKLKQVSLKKSSYLKPVESVFSPGEIALLREESFDLDDKGIVTVKPSNLQLKKNVRFAFASYAKHYGFDFKLKVDDAGWQSFLEAIQIRNRLMHPKQVGDLEVSEREIEITNRAKVWFLANMAFLLDSALKVLRSKQSELEARRAELMSQIKAEAHEGADSASNEEDNSSTSA
ncbi:MAG: hypothetical protein M3362_01500 [Acidobacteriota bacterium]|nr:hypothetical protein [Acidobacteriota bacterium]